MEHRAPALASLDPSGELDTTFNTTGYNRTNFAQVDTFAEARAVGIQKPGANAGRIVLAGDYQDGFDSHVALLRLNADGTQDTGFGAGGEVKTTVGANDLINDVAMHFSLGSRRSRCRSPLDHTGSLRPIRVM